MMVDPSGFPIYATAPQAEVYTLPSAVQPAQISTFGEAATATIANAALTMTAAAVEATSSEKSQAERIKDQQAIQAGLDSEFVPIFAVSDVIDQTPRNLMLAYMALLLLVMLLSHPRFLARLLASLRRPAAAKKAKYSFDTPPSSATPLQVHTTKPVGGGDLRQGWVLREGKRQRSVNDTASINSDPFASPFDDVNTLPSLSSAVSTPPPHIVPLPQHLPFSSTLYFAPFARLPRAIASSVSLSELYIIVGYLILNGFALVWRSDVTPTTENKGYGYDFYRTGLVATTQLPLVVALGVRGNIIGLCVGKGYEKLKRLHKIVGRVFFLAATLHTMFYCKSTFFPA